jgi:hypothetical protein
MVLTRFKFQIVDEKTNLNRIQSKEQTLNSIDWAIGHVGGEKMGCLR